MRQLLYYLRLSRCLLIFDELDAILAEQQLAGTYRKNYEQSGNFLQMIGGTEHQSCLIITSREKTREIALLEGLKSKAKSLYFSGCLDVSLALFEAKSLSGSQTEKQELARRYSNNPSALKMIATSIQDLFDGKIKTFISQKTKFFGISQFFEEQLRRLSSLEQNIIYWLAINRNWQILQNYRNTSYHIFHKRDY